MSSLYSRDFIVTLIIMLIPLCLALNTDSYGQRIMTLSGIYAIAAMGYHLIFGRLGALSLAQGCFFGLGAYSAALIGVHFELSFLTCLLFAVIFTALVALIIALPVLRLESHYFALATLGIAQVALLIAINWTEVTGGANGAYGIPQLDLFGMELSSSNDVLIFVWVILFIIVSLTFWIMRAPFNYQVTLLKDTPEVAASSGIDIGRWRLTFFIMSAIFGATSGSTSSLYNWCSLPCYFGISSNGEYPCYDCDRRKKSSRGRCDWGNITHPSSRMVSLLRDALFNCLWGGSSLYYHCRPKWNFWSI
jgi:ABC-type branched-subunit amino acid transport system permease subunit